MPYIVLAAIHCNALINNEEIYYVKYEEMYYVQS